ncbi:hypothetical protein DYQ86_21665 [Acidobacteria bacterium AB60]|nr:hypothetical protein DYQ86_21665 [Acidobacteria bacterium AB60]
MSKGALANPVRGDEAQAHGSQKRPPSLPRAAGSLRCLAAIVLLGLPVIAQSPGAPNPLGGMGRPQSGSHFPSDSPMDGPQDQQMKARRIKALNQLRHKAMVDDAARLLSLAKELNDEGDNLPPAERLHKTAEIERLAKSVKEKMSYTVGDNPAAPPIFSNVDR